MNRSIYDYLAIGFIMIAVLTCLFWLLGCNKVHITWGPTKSIVNKEEIKPIPMKTEIGGVEFSFDDGPALAYTPKVLDILKKYNLRATFFVEGINLIGDSEQAKERRELLKRISIDGHNIGNHSYDHKLFTTLSPQKVAWEIDTTAKLIENITGKKVELIRLPYGKGNKVVNKMVRDRGLKIINWQVDPREWMRDPITHQFKTATQVIEGIMKQYEQLHKQQGIKHLIIILHDTKSITVELLPMLLERLSKEL